MSEFPTREEVEEVRQELAGTWLEVLGRLKKQVNTNRKPLPESLVKNLKIASDQLRIEFRSVPATPSKPEEPEHEANGDDRDPLGGLRIVDGDAA